MKYEGGQTYGLWNKGLQLPAKVENCTKDGELETYPKICPLKPTVCGENTPIYDNQ